MRDAYPSKSDALPDALDFVLVPVEDARAALDALPPGVEKIPTLVPEYWQQRRRRPVASDRALTGDTIDWLLTLPASIRPDRLTGRYPRVVNAIAAAQSPQAMLQVLDDLLADRRGGRGGFPVEVRQELLSLRDWVAAAVDSA